MKVVRRMGQKVRGGIGSNLNVRLLTIKKSLVSLSIL